MSENASPIQPVTQSFVVDGIRTIAIHNNVVRVQFMTLDNDGEPVDSVRLMIPQSQIKDMAEALSRLVE
jgi:hypothetical protein